NLLEASVGNLAVEYNSAKVVFPPISIEPGMTATRGAVPQLPNGGETLVVTYEIGASSLTREAAVPSRPHRNTLPVVVLLPTAIPVEWHDAKGDIFDLSEEMEAKYGFDRP